MASTRFTPAPAVKENKKQWSWGIEHLSVVAVVIVVSALLLPIAALGIASITAALAIAYLSAADFRESACRLARLRAENYLRDGIAAIVACALTIIVSTAMLLARHGDAISGDVSTNPPLQQPTRQAASKLDADAKALIEAAFNQLRQGNLSAAVKLLQQAASQCSESSLHSNIQDMLRRWQPVPGQNYTTPMLTCDERVQCAPEKWRTIINSDPDYADCKLVDAATVDFQKNLEFLAKVRHDLEPIARRWKGVVEVSGMRERTALSEQSVSVGGEVNTVLSPR